MLPQGLTGNPQQVIDIAISPYERTVRFDYSLFLLLEKAPKPVRNIVRQPGAPKERMGLQSPHGKSSHLNRHPLLKGKQQTLHPIMLEGIGFLDSGSLFEDAFIGKNLVDSIQSFLGIAAAALEDKSLLISHPAELLFGNLLNTHSFISPIVIDCS